MECKHCGAETQERFCPYCGSEMPEYFERQKKQEKTASDREDWIQEERAWRQEERARIREEIRREEALKSSREVYSEKSWSVTLLLCLLFGYIGVHRFYTGKIASGILYICTGGGFVIGWLIDFIMILCGRFKDRKGRVVYISPDSPKNTKRNTIIAVIVIVVVLALLRAA